MAQTLIRPTPTLRDPEPEVTTPPPSRRTSSAAQTGVALLVCLGLWALLFAPVLERGAESGPIGARRTVALAILRPLTSLGDALSLTRASREILAALGRDPEAAPGGPLELPEIDLPPLPPLPPIDATPDEPEATAPPQTPSPSGDKPGSADDDPPEQVDEPVDNALRVPTPDTELRVAIVGDSLSQGLGPAIAELFDPDVSRVLPLGRQSTGLARVDYFNWQSAMRQIEEEFRPDLVFVMLGSNDNQAQVTREGDSVPVGSVAWVESYRERADAFLHTATSAGTRVVWVGIPVVREHRRWDFYRRVNEVFHDAAREDPFATYLDSWELFQGRDGDYAAFLRNEHGALQLMRAGDGIHLTPTGYAFLARHAVRRAAEAFDLSQRAVTVRV
jgi:hypothetical protein